jgi:HD superfamily phosphohydrolase
MTRVLDRFSERYAIDATDRIAARAAALLHDVGHGSFSHVMEKLIDFHHEQRTVQVILDEGSEIGALLKSYSRRLSKARFAHRRWPNLFRRNSTSIAWTISCAIR